MSLTQATKPSAYMLKQGEFIGAVKEAAKGAKTPKEAEGQIRAAFSDSLLLIVSLFGNTLTALCMRDVAGERSLTIHLHSIEDE